MFLFQKLLFTTLSEFNPQDSTGKTRIRPNNNDPSTLMCLSNCPTAQLESSRGHLFDYCLDDESEMVPPIGSQHSAYVSMGLIWPI